MDCLQGQSAGGETARLFRHRYRFPVIARSVATKQSLPQSFFPFALFTILARKTVFNSFVPFEPPRLRVIPSYRARLSAIALATANARARARNRNRLFFFLFLSFFYLSLFSAPFVPPRLCVLPLLPGPPSTHNLL
jgi:hypothetical protein